MDEGCDQRQATQYDVVDRIITVSDILRLFDSTDCTQKVMPIIDTSDETCRVLSEHYACPVCGFTVPELEPRLFSFKCSFGSLCSVMVWASS